MKRIGPVSFIVAAMALAAGFLAYIPAKDADAAERCLRIVRQGAIETLVNTCDACRIASLIRSRPGSEVPVGRRFNVQAKSTFPVPFRGPGTTRIKSEFPCPGEKGGDQDIMNIKQEAKPGTPECVSLEQASDIGIVLVNRCGTCRAVAIERYTADGAGRARAYLTVAGGSRAPVAANGFARVGLLAEIACPE